MLEKCYGYKNAPPYPPTRSLRMSDFGETKPAAEKAALPLTAAQMGAAVQAGYMGCFLSTITGFCLGLSTLVFVYRNSAVLVDRPLPEIMGWTVLLASFTILAVYVSHRVACPEKT